MPEVSLIAILDADKEGFLRSERSLVQTMGRAARTLQRDYGHDVGQSKKHIMKNMVLNQNNY